MPNREQHPRRQDRTACPPPPTLGKVMSQQPDATTLCHHSARHLNSPRSVKQSPPGEPATRPTCPTTSPSFVPTSAAGFRDCHQGQRPLGGRQATKPQRQQHRRASIHLRTKTRGQIRPDAGQTRHARPKRRNPCSTPVGTRHGHKSFRCTKTQTGAHSVKRPDMDV